MLTEPMRISTKDVYALTRNQKFNGRTFREGEEIPVTHKQIAERLQEHGFIGDVTRVENRGRGNDYYAPLTRLGAELINQWEPEHFRFIGRRAGNYVAYVRKNIDHEHTFADIEALQFAEDGSGLIVRGACEICGEDAERRITDPEEAADVLASEPAGSEAITA